MFVVGVLQFYQWCKRKRKGSDFFFLGESMERYECCYSDCPHHVEEVLPWLGDSNLIYSIVYVFYTCNLAFMFFALLFKHPWLYVWNCSQECCLHMIYL